MRTQNASFFGFVIFLFLFSAHFIQAEQTQTSKIQWLTDYQKAIELAKATSKPVVLFFTGSDWCGWCNKLEKEVLETTDFEQEASNKLIFVKLDFPMHTPLDPTTKKQNDELRDKFSVRSFPSIVLIDADQKPIGITGYRAGNSKQYVSHLMKMVDEYTAYKQQMQQLHSRKLSGKELKRLYQKARELGLQDDGNLLVNMGTNSDLSHFFFTERYRHLVDDGQLYTEEAASLKSQLLASDPENKYLTHYQVAVIDFEALCEEMNNKNTPPESAVKPLVDYLAKYGSCDKQNIWRINMVVSQVYLDKNKFAEALDYAEASLSTAPSSIQPDIAMAIKSIQTKLNGSN